MKKTTKMILGGLALVAGYELWTRRAAAGAAATAVYERATGTAPPPQPPVAGLDMGAPGHHRPHGALKPGRGGGGSSVYLGNGWGEDDPFTEALKLAAAYEQGRHAR